MKLGSNFEIQNISKYSKEQKGLFSRIESWCLPVGEVWAVLLRVLFTIWYFRSCDTPPVWTVFTWPTSTSASQDLGTKGPTWLWSTCRWAVKVDNGLGSESCWSWSKWAAQWQFHWQDNTWVFHNSSSQECVLCDRSF